MSESYQIRDQNAVHFLTYSQGRDSWVWAWIFVFKCRKFFRT